MQILIHDPQHPLDDSKAVALTDQQFEVCKDIIIKVMNQGMSARRFGKAKATAQAEAEIIQRCIDKDVPINFSIKG